MVRWPYWDCDCVTTLRITGGSKGGGTSWFLSSLALNFHTKSARNDYISGFPLFTLSPTRVILPPSNLLGEEFLQFAWNARDFFVFFIYRGQGPASQEICNSASPTAWTHFCLIDTSVINMNKFKCYRFEDEYHIAEIFQLKLLTLRGQFITVISRRYSI